MRAESSLAAVLAGMAAVAAIAALPGCHSPSAPGAPTPAPLIRPIHIDSVEVILPGGPAAHIQGVIGDGCTELAATTITRERPPGSLVTITILAQRPAEAICTQIAKLYDRTLRLPGDYPPGRYTLRVNEVETAFTVL